MYSIILRYGLRKERSIKIDCDTKEKCYEYIENFKDFAECFDIIYGEDEVIDFGCLNYDYYCTEKSRCKRCFYRNRIYFKKGEK